jgi:hypothetical protein
MGIQHRLSNIEKGEAQQQPLLLKLMRKKE